MCPGIGWYINGTFFLWSVLLEIKRFRFLKKSLSLIYLSRCCARQIFYFCNECIFDGSEVICGMKNSKHAFNYLVQHYFNYLLSTNCNRLLIFV